MSKKYLKSSRQKFASNLKRKEQLTPGVMSGYETSNSLIRSLGNIKPRGPITSKEKIRTSKSSFFRVFKYNTASRRPQDKKWYFEKQLRSYRSHEWFPRFPKNNIYKYRLTKPYFFLWTSSHKSYFLSNMRAALKRDFKKHEWFYRFRIDQKYKRSRKFSKFLLKKLRLMRIRYFYGIFSHKKFVKLLKTKKAKANHFQTHLYTLMECRLDVVLYRSCFCKSIYTAQQLVRHGHVTVEGEVIRNMYFPVKFYHKISFATKEILYRMQFTFFLQLRLKRLRFKPSHYLVVNYKYMFCFIRPLLNARTEVVLPYKLKSRHLSIR